MSQSRHIIVVGGGVIGLSIAWNLRRQGSRVTVLERDRTGQATSWAGAGILPPSNLRLATDPLDQLRGYSHELFPRWAEELQRLTGLDCGLRRCGGWYLADTLGEHASLHGMQAYWNQQGIECELVNRADLTSREPALSSWAMKQGVFGACWVPDEYQLRSPWYLRALQAACRLAEVEIVEGIEVTSIGEGIRSAEVDAGDRRWIADSVVICGGAWTGRMAASFGLGLSVIPIRGQILLLKTPRPLSTRVINVGQRYLVCREDGHILVGSCEEETGFELGTTPLMLESLRQFAVDVFPALKDSETIASWSGLRPMTFDGFPMIGRIPDCENLYVASGHYRSGLHLSPATAMLMTDLLLDRQPLIELEPFRVGKQQTHAMSPGETRNL
jgi:glycine oxidase